MTGCHIPTETDLDDDVVQRYLDVLGVPRRNPTCHALSELVSAHLTRVPFENISKLYRKRQGFIGLPDIRMFLDGIEQHHFGGTCYTNNFHFYTLLAGLGYNVKLCAADMRNPGVHMVIMVSLDGSEYLVDAGYAAPFLAPLPRNLRTDHMVALGRDRYLLKPQDAQGCSRLELHRDGVLKHGYLAKPASKKIQDFRNVIAGSFCPSATFFNAVLLARFYPGASVVIHNFELLESRGAETTISSLQRRDGLIAAIQQYFDMPRAIVQDALSDLENLADAWN